MVHIQFNFTIAGNENVINMIRKAIDKQKEMKSNENETTIKSYPCFLKEVDVNTWICYED